MTYNYGLKIHFDYMYSLVVNMEFLNGLQYWNGW